MIGKNTRTATLVQTDALKVVRLVVPAGKEIPTHQAPGEITVAEEIHHKGTKDTKKRG